MQVNNRVVPSLTASTGPARAQASPESVPTTPKAKPLPTPPPKKPSQAPIGSQQEADAALQQLANTPTTVVQEEAAKLEKTPKFKKAEDTIMSEVKIDKTGKTYADMMAKKTRQEVPNPTAQQTQPTQESDPSAPPQKPADVTTVGVGIMPTANGVYARFKASDRNIANTGVTVMISGGFGIQNTEEHLEDGRMLQVRSRMADISVGAKYADASVPVPVTASIGVGGSYDVAYARKPKDGEDLAEFRKSKPPSKDDLKANPTLLGVGDEIAWRGTFNVNASVGAVEPHSHVRFSVGVSVEREFVQSIKRIEGDPAKFMLRVEPGNTAIDAKATVAWGPFAVTGGGGYASTVYYEFEISEQKVKDFLSDGKLPVKIPDPSRYLGSDNLKTKMFNAFDESNPDARLVSMGATRSVEAFAEASATAAKARTTTGRSEAVYVRKGEVLHEDVHSMSAQYSAWFHGELKNSLSLTQSNLFTEVQGQDKLAKQYVGLEAAYKISDTKTSESDLRKRIELANSVLGRVSGGGLELPPRSDGKWGETSLSLKAEVTPEVLGKLEALGKSLTDGSASKLQSQATGGASGIFAIDYMDATHGVPRVAVESMLKDLHKIANDPKLQGNPDEIRREQGMRVAGFLSSSYTSVVNDEDLKLVATLQRLVGPEPQIVQLKASSDIHVRQFNDLAIEGFLTGKRKDQISEMSHTIGLSVGSVQDLQARISQEPWDRFNVGAQKLKGLEQIRENLVADRLIDKDEKETLLKKVDEFIGALNRDINAQISTPEGRLAVMKGLVEAGPLLPEKLQSLYSSPEKMYDDPNVRGELLDRVMGAAIVQMQGNNRPDELAGLIKQISRLDRGGIGIDQAFKALNAAGEIDPILRAQVVAELDGKSLAALAPRLTDAQRAELRTLVAEHAPRQLGEFDLAIKAASKKGASRHKEIDDRLNKLETELNKLEREQTSLIEPPVGQASPALRQKQDKQLLEHFKKDFKDLQQPLMDSQDKINENFLILGKQLGSQLNLKAEILSERTETLISGIDRMNPEQRQALFQRVMKQDVMGEVSQSILKRLIASSTSQGELIGFAQAIELKARKMDISYTDKSVEGVKSMAKTLKLKESDYTKAETREALQERLTEIRLILS